MTKLKVIIPITTNSFNGMVAKELEPLKKYGCEFDIENIPYGPTAIENHNDARKAYAGIEAVALQAEQEGYDGIFIDAFGEPAVAEVREEVDVPVVGGFGPSVLTASLLAQSFSILAVSKGTVPIFESLARAYGVRDNIVSIRSIDSHVLDFHDQEQLFNSLLQESKLAIAEGAQVIVLGCTGMLGVAERLQAELKRQGMDIPVVNPTLSAVMMLHDLVTQKLSQSRLTYRKNNRVNRIKTIKMTKFSENNQFVAVNRECLACNEGC